MSKDMKYFENYKTQEELEIERAWVFAMELSEQMRKHEESKFNATYPDYEQLIGE